MNKETKFYTIGEFFNVVIKALKESLTFEELDKINKQVEALDASGKVKTLESTIKVNLMKEKISLKRAYNQAMRDEAELTDFY